MRSGQVTQVADKCLVQFEKHMREVDKLGQVVLKAHLIIEEGLTRIIKLHVFNGDHIDDADLRVRKGRESFPMESKILLEFGSPDDSIFE